MVSSLDLYYLVQDLQVLVGSRVEKMYAPQWDNFFMQVHTKTGKQYVHIMPGKHVALVDHKEEVGSPSPFVMFIRKHLTQGVIKKVYQQSFERILVFEVKAKSTYYLLIELFAKGNLVLTDDKFTVLQCLQHQEFKDRSVKPGEPYGFPEPQRLVPFDLSFEEFYTMLQMSEKENLVKSLALEFSFGGVYAEYICAQAEVDKGSREVSESQARRLYDVILTFRDVRPDVSSVQHVIVDKQHVAWEKAIEKWKTRVAKQGAYVEELEKACVEEQRKGDLIYAHYTEVEQAILKRTPSIVLEGVPFALDPNRSVSQHATSLYDKAKKAKRKVDTARAVWEASKARLEETKANPPEPKVQKKKRQREWYEKFYWFTSSGGFLVVGGRDATTNDIVMKKHRASEDLVFHTEEPGSPFFVVQTQGAEVDADTIVEAAQAAASYSQQWKSGKKQVEVFYAKGSQCSKEQGDPVGTFHVSGERIVVRTTLSVAIGKSEIIIGGPPQAIEKICSSYVVLVPGKVKKGELAKKVAHKLGVSADDVIRFIPQGFGKIC